MDINYSIVKNEHLTDKHIIVFGDLLIKQNKVKGDLYAKADRCLIICLAEVNEQVVAIGGIKPKTKSDFILEKANLQSWEERFNCELGYLYTCEEYRNSGIASNIVKLLLNEYGDDNLMASTEITQNPGMVKILEKFSFRNFGDSWESGIHDKLLGLFLRYKNSYYN